MSNLKIFSEQRNLNACNFKDRGIKLIFIQKVGIFIHLDGHQHFLSTTFFTISEMFWPSLLMLSLVFAVVQSTQQCRSTYSKRGRYLKGHVISSENVKNIGVCYIKCSKDHRCKSINFHIDNSLCELNDADGFTHPRDYVLRKDHAYASCPGKVCVRSEMFLFSSSIFLFLFC